MMLSVGYRVLDPDPIAVNFLSMHFFLGLFGVIHTIKVDKCKAPRAASARISDQLNFVQASILFEHSSEIAVLRLKVEAEHS